MDAIILTEEMKAATALLKDEKERFIWISGRAGTGKSTFLQYLKTEIRPRNAVYLAPTGVAALTIGGQTIHSFFWIDPNEKAYLGTALDPDREGSLYPLLAMVETIVIDEISMVRADLLDEMDRRMRRAKNQPRLSFGGARLVLFGDPYQLPPVEPDPYSPAGELFERRYKSPFFFSSQACARGRGRSGGWSSRGSSARTRRTFLPPSIAAARAWRPMPTSTSCSRGSSPKAGSPRPTTSSSRPKRTRPGASIATASTACRALPASTRRSPPGSFAKALDDEELPAPRELELKTGARVMLTVNDRGRRWVNGTLATVTGLEDEGVILQDETGEFRVEPHVWKKVRFTLRSGQLSEESSDEYRQYPFVLGWAITIHRAQGRTLEKVFVDLSQGAFAAGQAYVAISRVTRLEGLLLRTRPRAARLLRP